jgi:hypothetical protein
MEDTVLQGTLASPRRMLKSESTIALDTAVLAAKPNYKPLLKTRNNPFFSSKYADLSDVLESVEAPLAAQGVLVLQAQDLGEGKLSIKTEIVHASSGEFRASFMEISANPDPQKMGSASTYLKRYAISTLAGVVADVDDDANAASAATSRPSDKPKVSQTPAKPTNDPRPGNRTPSTPVAASEPSRAPSAPPDTPVATPEPTTGGPAPAKEHARTADEKNAHSALVRELQTAANEDKVKEYIIVQIGPDYKKASFEKWDGVLQTMNKAMQAGTLAELVGA